MVAQLQKEEFSQQQQQGVLSKKKKKKIKAGAVSVCTAQQDKQESLNVSQQRRNFNELSL